ncbi:MAG: FAD-dependent oxidoreductase [Streptosporangiaceae bacterium]
MRYDTIVIDGCLAGPAAACDLLESGQSLLGLEARDRLGGRIWCRPFAGSVSGSRPPHRGGPGG